MFKNVREAHTRNLTRVLTDLNGWTEEMCVEVMRPNMAGAWVRIHDGGDFFSDEYLEAWLHIASCAPDTTFYCYTKEVERFRRIVEPANLPNFRYVFSYGGKYDHLITDADRQCDVFPDNEALEAAGYSDQADSDLLAVTGDTKVGIVVNRHPGANKAMGGKSLREQQAALRRA